ncbi:hypothetical protein R6Q59_004331 [Mikania micrantha]
MELFPAQPDLSLQISPPNTKPTSKTWRTSTTPTDQDHHHDLDLGNLWKRALNSQQLNQHQQQQQKTAWLNKKTRTLFWASHVEPWFDSFEPSTISIISSPKTPTRPHLISILTNITKIIIMGLAQI